MNNMKKVILFVVEGMSDKDALEPILSELINTHLIRFEVLRGDATASLSYPYYKKNMKDRIKIIVDNYLENNRGIQKKYIEKIIYITDTDGCYIDSQYIYLSEKDKEFRYEDDGIYTNNVERVKQRNELKSRNLNILNSASKIYHSPIETYYFSCNLDHVLYNIRQLKQALKEEYAINFADQFEGREHEFINFMNKNEIPMGKDYKDSWTQIKISFHSLLRHSNFHIFFKNNKQYLVNEVKGIV